MIDEWVGGLGTQNSMSQIKGALLFLSGGESGIKEESEFRAIRGGAALENADTPHR